MLKKLRAHFIPNSHLDREWTLDFQKHRHLLVQFLDRLLEIFKKIPEYTFLLDSQTIPLEDYLEIRPEMEETIRKYVREERLTIGPWYTAPDCQTITGESVVRNLLMGHSLAKKFGPVMKVGYTPFGFTQVSQLPQIYAGFGIDFIFFYRGVTAYESPSAEFIWEAPDGTRRFCSRFGSRSRYNFFMEVWRPVVFGNGWLDRIYNWQEPGLPFKRSGKDHEYDHYFLQRPKLEINEERILPSWKKLLELELPHYATPIIPLMQGMDTTMPDELEVELVKKLQKVIDPDQEIVFSAMPKFVRDLKRYLKTDALRVLKGEMRNPGPPSPHVTNLEHVISSRIRQKVKQTRAAYLLQRVAEPFSTLLYIMGHDYPKSYLDMAWKYLLQTHPHDTVAGCGVDSLEKDAHFRLEQVTNISNALTDEALGRLQARIDTTSAAADEIVITVFNPSPYKRTEVVEAYIDTPYNLDMPDFILEEIKGKKPVKWSFAYRKPDEKTVRNNTDLTMSLVGWMVKLHILAEDVAGMGYRTYVLRRSNFIPGSKERMAQGANRLENECLRVDFQSDGGLDLLDKGTGEVYKGLHYFEDQGEAGSGWESWRVARDRIISSKGCPVEISCVGNTPLSGTIKVTCHMRIPTGLIYNDSHHFTERGEKEVDLDIETLFTLRAGSRRLECVTQFDNNAKNHRLRVVFPTGISGAKHSCAETPFDVVERIIERGPDHPYSQAANPQYPCLRFVDVSDGKNGMAILTQGIHEYEVTDDDRRAVILTLLRSFEVTLCTVTMRWERRPDQILSQQLGPHELRYAIYPHKGDWDKGEAMQEAERFILPLEPAQSAPLRRDEAKGSALLPPSEGFLEIKPADIVLSGFKKAEDSKEVILRVFNPTTRAIKGTINLPFAIKQARLANMNEEPVKGGDLNFKENIISLEIAPKKVLTLRVKH
jgi:alpha-mannosidase